jgi:malate dehydrogenase (oxaloacetate-decarboxylating)
MERWVAENTNPEGLTGELSEVIAGADLFLGLSVPGILTTEHLDQMARDPIIFALANPDPEITPEEAEGRARIMATGRSDYPNQINNTLCFPGIFRGALDSRARKMNEEMKLAAARALAEVIPEEDLSEDYVIPSLFDERIVPTMAEAVAEAARESGSARTSLEQENPLETPSQA